jgi:exopolysaccharide production protein ExoQ
MKELILSSPLIMALLVGVGVLYVFVLFHYAGRNTKLVSSLEIIFFGVLLISIVGATGATIMPFDKLHPRILTSQTTTFPTIAGQIGLYGTAFFLLIARLNNTLKDFLEVLAKLLYEAPFFYLFLLWCGFSVFWSNTPLLTFKFSLVFLEISILAIYFGKQYSWKELYSFWRWINIIITFLCVYEAIKTSQEPWIGIIGHKNQFSFVMAQTAILWLMHAFYSRKQRNLSIGFVLLSLFALQKGGSGASKVLVVALTSLWGYLSFVKKLKVQWAFVSVILFMIVSICLTLIITENLKFIVVDTLNRDMTLTGRTEFWPVIINKINQHPIFGYGMAGFWQPWRGADDPGGDIIVARTQFQPMHAHNGFLDLALDLGWVGLGLFALSFFTNVAKAVVYLSRNRLPESGLPLLLLTYTLMTNFTETGLLAVSSIWFWYVVTTVRLTLDNSRKSQVETKRYREPAALESMN